MGPVVTINSATLVNKGLEVIEAHLLFGIPIDRIEVVVHPTSVVHSMVEFVDGCDPRPGQPAHDADPDRARAELARPGPRRRPGGRLDQTGDLGVLPPRRRGVPRGGSGEAGRDVGGTAPAVYNAANEVCVEAFRTGRLGFTEIVPTIVRRAFATRRTLEPGDVADGRGRPRRRRVGPGGRPQPSGQPRGEPEGEQPLLRARRRRLRRRHPGFDRAARARPHDPGQGLRREGHSVLHRLRPDRLERAGAARPSTASRRSRSAATSRSSGCCRRVPSSSAR